MDRATVTLETSNLSTSARGWLRRAALAARQGRIPGEEEYCLGAVVVRGGSLLSVGANRHRNKPTPRACDVPRDAWSFCAEELCLKPVKRADGATLYVARVTPGGSLAMARPCRKCAALAAEAGVTKIVYTTPDGVVTVRVRDLLAEELRDYTDAA